MAEGSGGGGGGYEDSLFVSSPIKDFQCPVCKLTLKEPLLLNCCGAHVCQDCLKRDDDGCPVCKERAYTYMGDLSLRGRILDQQVKCKYSPCTWTGKLLDYDKHIADVCVHAPVPCRLGCGESVPRTSLEEHEKDSCKYHKLDTRMKGMQRMLLMKLSESDSQVDTTAYLLLQFQLLFDNHYKMIGDQRSGRKETEGSLEQSVEEMNRKVQAHFERYEESLTSIRDSFDGNVHSLSEEMTDMVNKTATAHKDSMKSIEQRLVAVTEENLQLKDRADKVEGQATRLKDSVTKVMETLKLSNDAKADKEKEVEQLQEEMKDLTEKYGANAEMSKKKDVEIENLRGQVEALAKLLKQNSIDPSLAIIPLSTGSDELQSTSTTKNVEDDQDTLPLQSHTPEEENDEKLKEQVSNSEKTTPSSSDEADGDKEEEVFLKKEDSSTSSVSVYEHDGVRDVSVQFDYWVPMKDLLYGATVVDETLFNAHGDKQQTFNWTECGFSLHVPDEALSRTETCPVAVKALISGRFKFPKGFQLISALYPISLGRRFKKKVKIVIEHCFLIEHEEQLKNLHFIKACGTANPNDPYVFKPVKGGVFTVGSQYCELWQSEFSIYAAAYSTEDSVAEGNGSIAGSSTSGEAAIDTAGHDTGDEDTGSQHDDAGSQHDGTGSEQEDTDPDNNNKVPRPSVSDSSTSNVTSGEAIGTSKDEVSRSEVNATEHLPIDSTTNQLPTEGGQKSILYRAHFYYESTQVLNAWDLKLVAIRHLTVHIKYVKDTFSTEEVVESFKFRFLGCPLVDEPAITLVFTDEQYGKLQPGWFVKPLSSPCSIQQEEIDALCTQELRPQADEQQRVIPDLPMRKIAVFAEGVVTSHMEYCVAIEGIREKKTINIIRRAQTSAAAGTGNIQSSTRSPSNPNSRQLSGEDYSSITDVRKLKSLLIDQWNQRCADLESLLQGTLNNFASLLFQNGMISKQVKGSPQYDDIMGEVLGSLKFKRTPKAIIEHCKKILSIMSEVGGPQREAASAISEEMTDILREEFNTSISFM